MVEPAALGKALGIGAEVEVEHGSGLEPEPADDLGEGGQAGGVIDREMQVLVDAHGVGKVGTRHMAEGAEGGFRLRDARDIGGSRGARRTFGRETFDLDADGRQLA